LTGLCDNSGFGYRNFLKCNPEGSNLYIESTQSGRKKRENNIFLYPKPKLGQKNYIGLQILSLTSLDSELFAREKKSDQKWKNDYIMRNKTRRVALPPNEKKGNTVLPITFGYIYFILIVYLKFWQLNTMRSLKSKQKKRHRPN
jgi:hypothetical protein